MDLKFLVSQEVLKGTIMRGYFQKTAKKKHYNCIFIAVYNNHYIVESENGVLMRFKANEYTQETQQKTS